MTGDSPTALEDAIVAELSKAAPSSFSGSGVSLGSTGTSTVDIRAARLARLEGESASGAGGSLKDVEPPDAARSTKAAPSVAPTSPVEAAPPAPFVASPELLSMLIDMGFEAGRATRALQLTSNSSIEAAIEWLETHEGDVDVSAAPPAAMPTSRDGSGPGGAMTAEDDAAVASAEHEMQAASGNSRKLTPEEVTKLLVRRRAEKVGGFICDSGNCLALCGWRRPARVGRAGKRGGAAARDPSA